MRPCRRDALLCPGLVQFWLPSIKEDRRSAEGPRPTAVDGQPFGARPGGDIEGLRPLTRAAFLQEAGTKLTTPRAPPEAFVSRTPEAGSRYPCRRQRAGAHRTTRCSSHRLPTPRPSSRNTAGLQLASSWTRDGVSLWSGESGNKWRGNSTIFGAFFAAPRKCRLWRGVLRRREVRGDRRLRGADRPIESGAVRVHVCPPRGAGARRCLS